jgi:hypothetical protein
VTGQERANTAIMIRAAASGGMVFPAGTTDWPLALADPAISQITANVVSRLACRPLIIHGPVCEPGEYIGEGEMTGAGQLRREADRPGRRAGTALDRGRPDGRRRPGPG